MLRTKIDESSYKEGGEVWCGNVEIMSCILQTVATSRPVVVHFLLSFLITILFK